jgi:hypothetical protein
VLPVFLPLGSDRLGDPATRRAPPAGREDGSGMSMVYGEPVNVQARDDGRPVRFVWRGRLYTVLAILEHWVINREWWQAAEPPESPEAPESPESPEALETPESPEALETPETSEAPESPEAEAGRPELEFWRIEAAAGPGMTPGVYELRRETATGAWTLRLGMI